MTLASCRVVLVRPTVAANVGAAARVMKNMGLADLVLVRPEADPTSPEARRLSTRGQDVLDRARVIDDLGAALADCVLVAGTSARTGGPFRRQSVAPPDEVMPRVVEALRSGPAALLFGPEPSGLTDAEVTRCHWLIHIPADPSYPALNLAQAVAICLYELRRAWLGQAGTPSRPTAQPAPFEMQERMFTQLRQALGEIHFLYGAGGEPLMHALRHLIGRAGLTTTEVDLLFGLARQLRWYVERHRPS